MRWLGLMSGGLDSLLAARLVARAGLDAAWLHVETGCVRPAARARLDAWAAAPGAPELRVVDARRDYLRRVVLPDAADPVARRDPCARCRAFLLCTARAEAQAFRSPTPAGLFTGDVLGQGGAHQSHAGLEQLDRAAGVEGLVLRPLSAAWLAPPAALDGTAAGAALRAAGRMQGRGRSGQRALAAALGLEAEAPTQGGCCLRADPAWRRRLRDLIEHAPRAGPSVEEVSLLGVGRHFRLSWRAKALFARDAVEAARLAKLVAALAGGPAAPWTLEPAAGTGAAGALFGRPDACDVEGALALAARFGRPDVRLTSPAAVLAGAPLATVRSGVRPASDADAAAWRI